MKCSDLQIKLSLYADDRLDADERTALDGHLDICPLCRQSVADIREIKAGLRRLGRREIPQAVENRLQLAVRDELRSGRSRSVSNGTYEWLSMRLMPVGVGIAASLIIGFSFLTMMFNAAGQPGDVAAGGPETRILIAADRDPLKDDNSFDLSPADYAKTRMAFAAESPSINPRGALIALTSSIMRGKMHNDEVVVVADIFSNGLAKITDVVESNDEKAVEELKKAMSSDPSSAPFVTAAMDNRSENVRVVLRFQSVNVSTRERPKRR